MDNFRDSYFQVDWDLTTKRLKGTYWGKQYDTGRGFVVTVINGGQVVAPTTEVLRLKWEKPDNTTGYVNATIVDGKFIVENIDQMFTVKGSVRADFELSVAGESLASITFYVSVEKAVAVDAIESSSDFTALQDALADVGDMQAQVDAVIANATVDSEVILARGTEATLGARLDSTESDLVEHKLDYTTLKGVADKSIAKEKLDFISISTNLCNLENAMAGYSVNTSTGEPNAVSGYHLTDFIPIKSMADYIPANIFRRAFYDVNKVFLGSTANTEPFRTQANAKYVRLVINTDNIGVAQLNEGSTLLPYEPYYKNLPINLFRDKSITSTKRTNLGGLASITIGSPYRLPNIDLVNKKLQIFGQTYICWNDTRHSISDSSATIFEIDFSIVWADGGLSPCIYFDTELKTFKVFKSNQVSTVPESAILFCVLHKKDNGELIGVSSLFEYTIDGKKPYEISASVSVDKPYRVSNVPDGWYNAPVVESYSPLTMTLADIYDVYDDLVTANPSYVTRTLLGNDSTNTHPIYRYDFKPVEVVSTLFTKKLPKILIFTNLHGDEKASTISLRNLMRDICTNWKTNELLEWLRFNVEIIIIPIANPYGYLAHQRQNGNGVDLNRNFDYMWEEYNLKAGIGEQTYKGTAPFSEVETQYIRDLILENKDATTCYDYHMNGTSGDIYETMYWHYIPNNPNDYGFEQFNIISKYNINKLTIEAQKKYSVPDDSGYLGWISYTKPHPQIGNYAYSQGIPSMTIECTRRMLNGTQYQSEANQMNTEFVGNTILNTVREFSK